MLLSSLLLIPILGIFLISSTISYEGGAVSTTSGYGYEKGVATAVNNTYYKSIAFIASIVNLIISLIVYILFDFSNNQFQFVQEHYDMSFFDVYLGVDGISIYFVLLTTIIMPIALLSNWNSITENIKSYLIIMLLLETLLLAVFLVLDILLFYIFFESILPPLFLLIGLFGSSNKVRASFYIFLYTLAGSLFLLLSILTMSSIMGTTDFDALFKTNFDYTTQIFLFCGIFIAFAVKTPTIFLNNWLLKAHVESPLGGSIVLAGISMLALYLAICWENLKRSISRKLLTIFISYFNSLFTSPAFNAGEEESTLKENDTLKLEDIDKDIKLNRIPRGHTLDATNISSYLTGLVEGDGCLYVPENSKGAATVSITFVSKDLPLILIIQKELKAGNIYKVQGKNAYNYVVSDLEGLISIIRMINGHMRTPKINKLYNLIDWINIKNSNIKLEKLPLDNSNLGSNAWLAGFIDSDGCFYIRVTKNLNCSTYKIACLFELAQKTSEEYSMLDIITKLSEFLSTDIKYRSKSSQFWVRTSKYESNKILISYLNNYPLFSSKHLDFLDWERVLNIMIKKEQVKRLEEIKKIKDRINSKRTHFSWDHLQNFYKF